MNSVGFIGGGRITRIILQALKNKEVSLEKILIYDINEDALNSLRQNYPYVTVTNTLIDAAKMDLVILAVHPPVVMETLEKIKNVLNSESVLLSLSPKISLQQISNVLKDFSHIARMNPSASSIVNKGVNPVSFSTTIDKQKKELLLQFMSPLGYMPEVTDEKIEAYAVISAMGPTYFNFQIEKLRQLAQRFGMDEKEAKKAIRSMLEGTVDTLFSSDLSYQEVCDLIPVKPMGEVEETIEDYYEQYLTTIYNKIR